MRILVIAPHPDDESIGMGGTIAREVAAGNEVDVLFLTSGEQGIPGLDAEKAGPLREAEAYVAGRTLGYRVAGFWRFPDGGLPFDLTIVDTMAFTMRDYDAVYVTHGGDNHHDHRVAARLATAALERMGENGWKAPQLWGYEVWSATAHPARTVDVTPYIDLKLKAIQAHASQVERQAFDAAALSLNRYRGITAGNCTYAETFSHMGTKGEGMLVSLVLLTYAPSTNHPRAEYARTTLRSVLANLDVGVANRLQVHIADDGSDPDHVLQLAEIARSSGYEPTSTNAQRGGYGKSYNMACQALHDTTDLMLPLEDDWQLMRPLNLERAIEALTLAQKEPADEIRSIRLGYLGITQELRGKVVNAAGQSYLLLDPASPEPHVFCGHPRLETVAYERAIGDWPEGKRAGDTEWEITHRQAARVGVAWPLDLGIPAGQDWGSAFAHVGAFSTNLLEPGMEAANA